MWDMYLASSSSSLCWIDSASWRLLQCVTSLLSLETRRCSSSLLSCSSSSCSFNDSHSCRTAAKLLLSVALLCPHTHTHTCISAYNNQTCVCVCVYLLCFCYSTLSNNLFVFYSNRFHILIYTLYIFFSQTNQYYKFNRIQNFIIPRN